jgi:hypothetical protein
MPLADRVEDVLAALKRRDTAYPAELANRVKAEFLHGAAVAFAASWRGEESQQCLMAAKALEQTLVGETATATAA